jgi:hypothetical protein
MTVINSSYSTLEEAWGGNFINKGGKQKKKTRFVQDPLCDLYAKKNLRTRKPYGDDTEPQGVDDSLYGLYNKNSTSRTTKDSKQNITVRTPQYKPINVEGVDEETHDAGQVDDDDAYLERYLDENDTSAILSEKRLRRQYAVDRDNFQSRQLEADIDKDKLIDLALYISSGILMIFTMEQVLQLGMRMSDR